MLRVTPEQSIPHVRRSYFFGDIMLLSSGFFCVIGTLFTVLAWTGQYKGYVDFDWPSAPGTITDSSQSVCRGGKTYRNEVQYTFFLNGKSKSGYGIQNGLGCGSKKRADKISEALSIETRVNVFYNPRDRASTVLLQGNDVGSTRTAIGMSVFSVLCFIGAFARRRYIKNYDAKHPL